jgi:Domain of unknown function (DUF4136)
MPFSGVSKRVSPLLAVAVIFCGLAMAGCDEHVETIRDRTIPVLRHQTWAWRPAEVRKDTAPQRPVISRDVIAKPEVVNNELDPNNEIVRSELRGEIERQLTAKGLTQASDPAAADFLVDYHFAMRGRNVRMEGVYPGGYGGLVCGPYGCYRGWGYGPEISYGTYHFREGSFVLDVFKSGTNKVAYRAIGEEPIHHETFSQGQIKDMVHALLKNLKPGK